MTNTDNIEQLTKILEGEHPTITHRRMSDIPIEAIEWLWRKQIARGKVVMIAGDPGLGKSQLTASVSAIVTTGGLWPASTGRSGVGKVIILSAEDDPADTIRPRLEATGADLTRISIVEAVNDGGSAKTQRCFDLERDLNKLASMMEEIGDVSLVIIDPVMAYLGNTDAHKSAEVVGLLLRVAELARRFNVAVVLVSHLNKSSGKEQSALQRVMGSGGFVSAVRAAYLVAKDKDIPGRRLLLPLKNNVGNDKTGFAFRIVSHTLPNGIETSRVEWEAHEVDIQADQALTSGQDDDKKNANEEAKDFLKDILADGPIPAKQVKKEATDAGIAAATLRKARESLKVENVKQGFGADGRWEWRLPAPKEPDPTDAPSDSTLAS